MSEVVIIIPLNDNFTDCPIYQVQIDKWVNEYPGVNIVSELIKIKDWNEGLPSSKRQTSDTIGYHITNWFRKVKERNDNE